MHDQLTQHLLEARALVAAGDITGARILLRRLSPVHDHNQHLRWLEARIALHCGQYGMALSTLWTMDMRKFVPLTAADHKLVLLDELTAAMHCGAFHEAADSAVTLMIHHGVIAAPMEALTSMWADGPTTHLEELLSKLPDSVKVAAAHHFSTLAPSRSVTRAAFKVFGNLIPAPRATPTKGDSATSHQHDARGIPPRRRPIVPAQRTSNNAIHSRR